MRAREIARRPATGTRPGPVAVSFAYDASGNLLSETVQGGSAIRTLGHDMEDRVESVLLGQTGVTTTFGYDGGGERRTKHATVVADEKYFSPILEWEVTQAEQPVGSGGLVFVRKYVMLGGMRVALSEQAPGASSPTVRYVHGDHLGSASVVTDSRTPDIEETKAL